MKAFAIQSKIKRAINFAILPKPMKEIKAFIGIWYIRGLPNWTFHDIATFFYSKYGHKIFNAIMSTKGFHFLC